VAQLAIPDLEAAVKGLIDRDAVTIPPYPGVAMRLQQLVSGGNYGMNDLAKVAMTDPVVTGHLLRAANSAALRGASKINSVGEAVTRMGAADVVRIAIAASLGAQAGKRGALASMRRRIWQESLASAVVCFHLASVRRLNPQEGFVCGLLHDIGKVVATSSIETLLAQHKDERRLTEAEWMTFIDRFHVDIGLVTARKWTLSEMLQTVIAAHHDPERSGTFRPMVDLVRASDEVVSLMMREAIVTEMQLVAQPSLTEGEARTLLNALPGIGAFVSSMDESPVAAAPAPAQESQVLAPAPVAASNEAAVDFPGGILRANGLVEVRFRRLGKGTVAFTCRERQPHKYLVKLQLRPPDIGAFEVHASVEGCTPHAEGFMIECRLFALSGGARDKWAVLIEPFEASGQIAAEARAARG
jgi:putative nucleotidyltransferase with HDIG domain